MRQEYRSLKVTEHGQFLIEQARAFFSETADRVEGSAPPSRVRSIAITKLEEASHFAIRAIAEAHRVEE